MDRNSPSAVITQAERELEETRGLVEQQFKIVKRLKRLRADTKDAICFLIDLLELQERRGERLAHLRMRYKSWEELSRRPRITLHGEQPGKTNHS